jgi:hypothetical protein
VGNQVGDDIRISAGAMQFLAKHIKEVSLKSAPGGTGAIAGGFA